MAGFHLLIFNHRGGAPSELQHGQSRGWRLSLHGPFVSLHHLPLFLSSPHTPLTARPQSAPEHLYLAPWTVWGSRPQPNACLRLTKEFVLNRKVKTLWPTRFVALFNCMGFFPFTREWHINVCTFFFFHFVLICVVFPQASIYDDTGLYGSGYSSRAVSLTVENKKRSFSVAERWHWLHNLNFVFLLPSFLLPLTPPTPTPLTLPTALWIQLVLLWSQLHPQQPRGEHFTAPYHLHLCPTTNNSFFSAEFGLGVNYLEVWED